MPSPRRCARSCASPSTARAGACPRSGGDPKTPTLTPPPTRRSLPACRRSRVRLFTGAHSPHQACSPAQLPRPVEMLAPSPAPTTPSRRHGTPDQNAYRFVGRPDLAQSCRSRREASFFLGALSLASTVGGIEPEAAFMFKTQPQPGWDRTVSYRFPEIDAQRSSAGGGSSATSTPW